MDGILISSEVKLAKPDPAIFRHFLARFGLTAETTVFIDDRESNVTAAAALGMRAILFTDSTRLRTDLRAIGLPLDTAAR
jgi:2-haloacid dehalogenase